ncbi:MAG TPA: citrate synthase [archaeon]|nr:citrate synthase [archaeon]
MEEMKSQAAFAKGLEGVVAGETKICFLDGIRGKLLYRGYDINDLAKTSTFEEVAYLLLMEKLPTKQELNQFSEQLKAERKIPQDVIDFLKKVPNNSHPMDVLRTTVSILALHDIDTADISLDATLRKAIRLTAQIPVALAYYHRIREGNELIQPNNELGHAANFLYMMFGKVPSKDDEKIFDVALILHAEHEFNASTFATRETISTLSDLHSAIVTAIGTLKGPLHGGANERVLTLLNNIGSIDAVDNYIRDALARKEKIMGFGHRIYKTVDPRAAILKGMAKQLCEKIGKPHLFEMSDKIEGLMKQAKNLHPNVDFYSASVYHALGFPTDFFTPIFVVSRITGWSAHALEQLADNRIIRPIAIYTGEMDKQFIPLDNR